MAEKIVSPGVFTRENDLSFLSQGIGEIGAAIIGPFHKGPAFVPTVVNTQSEFESIFGTPNGDFYTGYTVQNYLREAGTVTIVRVGHVGGYVHEAPIAVKVTDGVNTKVIGTLNATHNGDEKIGFPSAVSSSLPSSYTFNIGIDGVGSEVSASILPSAGNDLSDVFGENARGSKNAYVYTYFENEITSGSGGTAWDIIDGGGEIVLETMPLQNYSSASAEDINAGTTLPAISPAFTPWIKSQLISGERHDLFRLVTLGDGSNYNKEYKVSIFNVKAAGESNSTDYATFSMMIRGYSDTDKRKSVLETYNNLTLDPASPNYINKIIGDINITIDANGKQTFTGDYSNSSQFVRVETKDEGSFPIIAGPFGHGAYTNTVKVNNETEVPAVVFSTGSSDNTSSNGVSFSGIDLETSLVKIDNSHYLKPLPSDAGVGANVDFAFDSQLSFELTGSDSADVNKRQFTVGFQGGFDGVSPTISIDKGSDMSTGNSQGFNISLSSDIGTAAYVKAINAVSNPDDFDINLVSVPGVIRQYHSYVFDKVVDMVESREDAFFIGDVVGVDSTINDAIKQGNNVDSNYVGTYYPWVKTIDSRTNKLTSVPPSVLMPGIYASNDAIAAEWFAPAGLNRGGIVGAVSVLNRLTHAERDTLYEGKINPIAQFPGEGIVAFGQKTLQDRSSALDRINVRRLLIKVKKYIASTSRYLVFEQNTAQTRGKFLNTVNPYLEGIQQRQGLYSFRVVMDESNNTPDVIDRNILAGAIYLQPTKTAEFIVIDFNILPTGASFTA